MKSNDNDSDINSDNGTKINLNSDIITNNSLNDESGYNNSSQMNTLNFNSTVMPMPNSIELLDNIIKARDELFEKQLNDGFKAHRKLAGLVMK